MKKIMKEFAAAHKGESFSATGLAKALGWGKNKNFNTTAAVRLAKKCGAMVTHEKPAKDDKRPVGKFDIVF